jgi:hypothetical protein
MVAEASLCAKCATIDLQEAFKDGYAVNNDGGRFATELEGIILDLRNAACPLCQLFASVCPSDRIPSESTRCRRFHLRSFSGNRLFARLTRKEMSGVADTVLLGVVRVGIETVAGWIGDKIPPSQLGVMESLKETGCLGMLSSSSFGVRRISPMIWDVEFGKECSGYCRM